jgi:hypothetical protein
MKSRRRIASPKFRAKTDDNCNEVITAGICDGRNGVQRPFARERDGNLMALELLEARYAYGSTGAFQPPAKHPASCAQDRFRCVAPQFHEEECTSPEGVSLTALRPTSCPSSGRHRRQALPRCGKLLKHSTPVVWQRHVVADGTPSPSATSLSARRRPGDAANHRSTNWCRRGPWWHWRPQVPL